MIIKHNTLKTAQYCCLLNKFDFEHLLRCSNQTDKLRNYILKYHRLRYQMNHFSQFGLFRMVLKQPFFK